MQGLIHETNTKATEWNCLPQNIKAKEIYKAFNTEIWGKYS